MAAAVAAAAAIAMEQAGGVMPETPVAAGIAARRAGLNRDLLLHSPADHAGGVDGLGDRDLHAHRAGGLVRDLLLHADRGGLGLGDLLADGDLGRTCFDTILLTVTRQVSGRYSQVRTVLVQGVSTQVGQGTHTLTVFMRGVAHSVSQPPHSLPQP